MFAYEPTLSTQRREDFGARFYTGGVSSTEQTGEDRAAAACAAAVRALREAGIAPEGLAELEPEGRRLRVLRRPPRMRPIGEVWRLGTLLLGADGRLYAAGRTTRAAERGRTGYQSLSLEDRRELAAAALRGGYPAGAPVNFDAVPLPLGLDAAGELGAEAPLGVAGGELRVRWRAGAPLEGAQTLEQYLAERVGLLVDPPLGAID